jgi:hypothetical protein
MLFLKNYLPPPPRTGGPPVTNIRNRRAATARCGFTVMPDGLVNTIAAT